MIWQTDNRWLEAQITSQCAPLLDSILWQVSEKYEDHQKSGSEFPHELGLLLGYPAVDVRGFMKNAGKNFLTGYNNWRFNSKI